MIIIRGCEESKPTLQRTPLTLKHWFIHPKSFSHAVIADGFTSLQATILTCHGWMREWTTLSISRHNLERWSPQLDLHYLGAFAPLAPVRATSHMRLKACDYCILRHVIDKKKVKIAQVSFALEGERPKVSNKSS